MDPTLPIAIVQNLVDQALAVSTRLAGAGQELASSLSGLAIIAFGVAVALSMGALLGGAFEMLFWFGTTAILLGNWHDVLQGCLSIADRALELLGITGGPQTLFSLATNVVARIADQPFGFSLISPSESATAMFRVFFLAVVSPFILLALAWPGLLAMMAKLDLILGAAVLPLLVPGLGWSVSRPLAFGAINFLISGTLRVIVLSLVSVIFARALEALVVLPTADEPVSFGVIAGLALTGALALLYAWRAGGIAGSIVGSGVGALTLGGVTGIIGAAVSAAKSAASGSGGGAASGGGGSSGGGGTSAGSMPRSSGWIRSSSGSGNPFV